MMSEFLSNKEQIAQVSSVDTGDECSKGFKPLIASHIVHTKTEPAKSEELHNVVVCEEGLEGPPPKIQLLTEAGEVKRIMITCTCGQYIELECNY